MKFINPQFAFILLILNIFTSQNAWSQKDFRPASLYGLKGDTITGWIDYRNWERNPHRVSFRPSSTKEVVEISPMDILGFVVQKEKYVSAIVQSETSPTQLNNLQGFPDLNLNTDTVFLRALYEGEKSLYMLINQNGRENFYIRQSDSLALLQYKKYIHVQNDNMDVTENKRYIGQLTLYLDSCSSLAEKLKGLDYNHHSVGSAFRQYYKCRSITPAYQFKRETIKVEAGVLAGVLCSSLTIKSSIHPDLGQTEFPVCVDFFTGLHVDLIRPRNQGKWAFRFEKLYTRFHTTGTYEEFFNPEYYSITTIKFVINQLKNNYLIRYRYPFKKWQAFGNIGYSRGSAIGFVNDKSKYSKLYNYERTQTNPAVAHPTAIEQAVLIGVGFKYKHLSFEFRYELGDGFSNNSSVGTTMNRFYWMTGISF